MHLFFRLCPLLLLAFLAQSCAHRLGAGLFGNDVTYLHRPAYRAGAAGASATYLSGNLNVGRGFSSQGGDFNGSANVALHQAHTWKHGSIAYGGFAYAGKYWLGDQAFARFDSLQRREVNPFAGRYGYYGWGLRTAANFSVPLHSGFDWRIAGLDLALSREYGALTTVRRQLADFIAIEPNNGRLFSEIVVRDPLLFTFGLSSELCWKNQDDQFSFRYFWGRPAGGYSQFDRGLFIGGANVSNCTLAYQNEREGWAGFVQLAQPFTKTTMQIGVTRQLGQVRRRLVPL
ncbi:MAG: hypothetical protein LH606_22770 [Cytophagaceae bacterium]|nr:hypothetical protein [Cytophagaceae bacterium]